MTLSGDDRAVTVQIGAVVLFGFLVASMAIWQATVVPQENARIEYEHNQRVQDDVQNVRNSIVSAPGGANPPSVGVEMAPQYPTRTLFVNPPRPTATVRTVGTTDPSVNLTIDNATAAGDVEAADYWTGKAHTYQTGGLAYEPDYNGYTDAPTTVYENSVVYNRHANGANLTLAGQNLIDGTRISLVALNGSLRETRSATYTVDPSTLSGSTTTVAITNATGNVTVSFASRLDAAWWNETLSEQRVENGGNVVDVRSSPLSGGFYNVTLELAGNETYTLRMAKVGVGSGTTDTSATYVTDVRGNAASVPEGGSQQVVVVVRDEFNNPVSGVSVTAQAAPGNLLDDTVETNADGEAVFTYEAPPDVDGSQKPVDLNVTFQSGVDPASSDFDGGAPENISMALYVQNSDRSGLGGSVGGGGAYSVNWQNPALEGSDSETTEETLSDCSASDCTWNVGAGGDDELNLTAVTTPTVQDANVEFAVNDRSIATVSPNATKTDAGGATGTTLTARSSGTVKVFVITGGSSDVINVTLTNVGGGQEALLSAVQPDSDRLDDSDGEFVRVYFPSATDTTDWKIVDDEGSSQNTSLPSETLTGEIYFARNPGVFARTWSIDPSRVYKLDTELANGGEPLRLLDGDGNVVDEFAYGSESTSNDWSVSVGTGEVAYRVSSGGTYDDTDDAADWQTEEENVFFNTRAGSTPGAGAVYVNGDGNLTAGHLQSIDPSGRVGFYDVTNATVVGPMDTDFDGDGLFEVPFVDGSGNIYLVDRKGEFELLVDSADTAARTGPSRMATGDLNGDGTAALYFVSENDVLHKVEPNGTITKFTYSDGTKEVEATAIAGVGDFTGDGSTELVFVGGANKKLDYVNANGEEPTKTTRKPSSPNAVGPLRDYDGDGTAEVPYVNNQNNIVLANSSDTEVITDGYNAAEATALAAQDIDGDGTAEILHRNSNTGGLYYADVNGTTAPVKDEHGFDQTATSGPGAASVRPVDPIDRAGADIRSESIVETPVSIRPSRPARTQVGSDAMLRVTVPNV